MRNLVFTSGALLVLATASLSSAASYTFTSISAPGETSTSVAGINNSGEIVGTAFNSLGVSEAFIDNNGSFSYIAIANALTVNATGVNNAGEVVGNYLDANGMQHGFTDVGGVITSYDTTIAGATGTSLNGVNNAGTLVGTYTDSSFNGHGFAVVGSTTSAVGPSSTANGGATGVNASGQIIGISGSSSFLDANGTYTTITDGTRAEALGINSAAQIVGDFGNTTGTHGFLYVSGAYTTIDDPNGVGSTVLTGINDAGLLIGYYTDTNGNTDSFIATPAAAAPEPASLLLLGAGAVGLAVLRRRSA